MGSGLAGQKERICVKRWKASRGVQFSCALAHQADWPGCLQSFRKLADMPNLCKLLLQNGFPLCLKGT